MKWSGCCDSLGGLCDNREGRFEFGDCDSQILKKSLEGDTMAGAKEWLNQKFRDWEKTQGKPQSYYSFARYLGVSQTVLAAWMDGAVEPQADDLGLIAAKLGPEIYAKMGTQQPKTQVGDSLVTALEGLPAGLRERLTDAVIETAQMIRDRGLAPDSVEAKRAAVEAFASKGIRLTN